MTLESISNFPIQWQNQSTKKGILGWYNFPQLYGKTNALEREKNQLFYYGVKGGDSKLENRRILYYGVWIDGKLNGNKTFGAMLRWHWSTGEKTLG